MVLDASNGGRWRSRRRRSRQRHDVAGTSSCERVVSRRPQRMVQPLLLLMAALAAAGRRIEAGTPVSAATAGFASRGHRLVAATSRLQAKSIPKSTESWILSSSHETPAQSRETLRILRGGGNSNNENDENADARNDQDATAADAQRGNMSHLPENDDELDKRRHFMQHKRRHQPPPPPQQPQREGDAPLAAAAAHVETTTIMKDDIASDAITTLDESMMINSAPPSSSLSLPASSEAKADETTAELALPSSSSRQATDTEETAATDDDVNGSDAVDEEPLSTSRDNDELIALQARAAHLRHDGKERHDAGQYENAAALFAQAADLLEAHIESSNDYDDVMEEYVTNRLHQALCLLKLEQFADARDCCTRLVEDDDQHDAAALLPAVVRARALHRRAKANVALHDTVAALTDARAAAFLGDARAVSLYGRLMREQQQQQQSSSSSKNTEGEWSSQRVATAIASSNALLESLLGGSRGSNAAAINPLTALGGMGSNAGMGAAADDNGLDSLLSSMLMKSVLSKGGRDSKKKGADAPSSASLAASVMTALVKKLQDEATQDRVCELLQHTSPARLQQYAALAGLELREEHAARITRFCQGVTPRTLQVTLRRTQMVLYVVKLARKTTKVLRRYRTPLILLLLLTWTKSAVLRPVPVDRRAARRAAKAALNAAI